MIVLRDGCVIFRTEVVFVKTDVTDDVTDGDESEEVCDADA